MSLEENKALVQRFVEEILNNGKSDLLADFFVPGSFLMGGIGSQIQVMKIAFPDGSFKIDEMVAEADKDFILITFIASIQ